MRLLFVLCIVGVLALWLIVEGSYGEEDNYETNVCNDGDTNYTRSYINYTTITVSVKRKIRSRTETCSFFGWFCSTKYKTKYIIEYEDREVSNLVSISECCPGYTNQNGSCIEGCSNNTYGVNCSLPCNCPERALNQCDRNTGNCTCIPGRRGDNCSEECPEGKYGINCEFFCFCKNGASCHNVTGDCVCSAGWQGDICDEECSNNTFGEYCNQTCNCSETQICDHVTGNCSTCRPGWTDPPLCNISCSDWTYGANCSSNCSCHRERSVFCTNLTGQCLCRPGYTGPDCREECPMGTYGEGCSNNCTNCTNGICDHVNGTCMCFGSKGDNCTEECDKDSFGLDCASNCTCDDHHSNGSCDPCSGICHCEDGWTGPECDIECPAMLDRKGCQSLMLFNVCDPYTRSWRCQKGWTGELCNTVCPSGLYGYNCSEACTCNTTTHVCNPVTGECVCKPGRTGDGCVNYCQNNTYGFSCRLSCNCTPDDGPCHHENGSCACANGWNGDFCSPSELVTPDGAEGMQSGDDVMVYVLGACGAVLALVVVSAIMARFLIKRRRPIRGNKPDLQMSAVHANITYGLENHEDANEYCPEKSHEVNEIIERKSTRTCLRNNEERCSEYINDSQIDEDSIHVYESGETAGEDEGDKVCEDDNEHENNDTCNNDTYDDDNNYADVDDVNNSTDVGEKEDDHNSIISDTEHDEEEQAIANTNIDETYDICDSLGNSSKPIIDDTYNTFDDFKHPNGSETEEYDVAISLVSGSVKKKNVDEEYNTFAQVRQESKKLKKEKGTDDSSDSDSYDNLGYHPQNLRYETDIYNVAAVNQSMKETENPKSKNRNDLTNMTRTDNDLLLQSNDVNRMSEPLYEECSSNSLEPKIVKDIPNDINNDKEKSKTYSDNEIQKEKDVTEMKPESYENCVLPPLTTKNAVQDKNRQQTKTLKTRERRAVDYEDFPLKF